MSSPFDHSLPLPPPPSAINCATPGDGPHTKWDPIYIHTAKCDKCHEHNTSVIQRCPRCNRQLCRKCILSANLDGIHVVDSNDLDWNVYARTTVSKKSKSGKSVPKRRRTPSLPTASLSGITKNVAHRRGSRVPSEGLFMEPDSTFEEASGQNVVEQHTSSPLDKPKTGRGLPKPIHSFVGASRQLLTSSSASASTSPSSYRTSRTKILLQTSQKGSSLGSSSGSSPFATSSGSSEVEKQTVSRPILSKHAVNPAAKAVMESLTGNVAASVDQSSHTEQIPCVRLAAHAKENAQTRRETFNEAISRLKEEREVQAKSKQQAFQLEMISAWELNPDICALRREGKIVEANELMEAAATLIRSQRGL